MPQPTLLLCSASPRRRDLLSGLGLRFEVLAPHIDESRRPGEPLAGLPERLAREKALAGLALHRARAASAPFAAEGRPALALAADTVVTLDGEELGKPRDRAHARALLGRLSGRTHLVTTGVCVLSSAAGGDALTSCSVQTAVHFRALSEDELSWLAATGDGDDKAGGYGVQGLAGAFIDRLEGSFTNVVGLPLTETLSLLAAAGLALPWSSVPVSEVRA